MDRTSVLEALRAPNQQLFEQACLAAGFPVPDTPQASETLVEACLRGAKFKADLLAKALPPATKRAACLDVIANLCWYKGWHEFQSYAKRFAGMAPEEQRQRPESYRMTVAAWALSFEHYENPFVHAVLEHQAQKLKNLLQGDELAARVTAGGLLFRSDHGPDNWSLLVGKLMDAKEAGDVDGAAACVTSALSTTMERWMIESIASIVNNTAVKERRFTPAVTAMLCKAADRGFLEFAYNAANGLLAKAKGAADYREAEKYYLLAMGYEGNPATQAAAHVNYCRIVRDGLITGKPDWPAAVEIYEKAARMGLVKGMFNAGNVSQWLNDQGNKAYGKRAAYWFTQALEHRSSGKPSLDKESAQQLEEEVYGHCMAALSALHIDQGFEAADLEEGIRWARELALSGDSSGLNNLGVGRIQRLAKLSAKPERLPGANWRTVLSALDWRFRGDIETLSVSLGRGKRAVVRVDKLQVEMADGSAMPLFVTHHACLPQQDGFDLLKAIGHALAKKSSKGFFLLPRKALFVQVEEQSCSPIYLLQNGELTEQSLWAGGSPDLILRHAKEGLGFPDERLSNWSSMIPIAVNALDEGFVVADHTDFGQPYVSVPEPWRMPFVDEVNLLDLRIILRGGPVR